MISGPSRVLTWPGIIRWCAAAVVCMVGVAVVAAIVGEPVDLRAAMGDFSWSGPYETADGLIFWQTRVPRVLAGLVAGAGLACSGLAYQAVLRNPLADPYILGVSSGAAIGKAFAVLALPVGVAGQIFLTPALCFAGALVPVLVLLRLAAGRAGLSPVTLLLAGAIMNLVLSAAMMLVQVFANPDNARQITYWWLGGLDVTGYLGILAAVPIIAGAGLVLIRRSHRMNLLSLDPLTASHLGLNVPREMLWILASGTIMAAAAVALCGPIGFAGLLVPHVLRLVVGADNRLLVPLSLVTGGTFLVLCDVVGRRAMAWVAAAGLQVHTTAEIPAGVITALLGGPLFLWLLARRTPRV